MRLNDIAEPIFENVEKLLPHLRDEVTQYLAIRNELGAPPPAEFPRVNANSEWGKKALNKWVDNAIEWALRSDPKYLQQKKKGKSLDKIKSPFVRPILKWWLDPRAGSGIDLPEDIETTAETLQKFNVAKQHGLNADPRTFENWDDLVATLQPYMTEEEISSDTYSRMGLDLVFSEGPWKMYLVDQWVPGDQSTITSRRSVPPGVRRNQLVREVQKNIRKHL